jgi:hypothetical protein
MGLSSCCRRASLRVFHLLTTRKNDMTINKALLALALGFALAACSNQQQAQNAAAAEAEQAADQAADATREAAADAAGAVKDAAAEAEEAARN